jgi:hypothetical protein
MNVLIAGSRTIYDYRILTEAVNESGYNIGSVISGGARGVDKLGEQYANNNNISVQVYIPSWNLHGKAAGVMRNTEMVSVADAAIILWDGQSKGTKDTITKCQKKGIPVYIKIV